MVNPTLSEIAQIWDRVLEKLQTRINDRHIFDSFFGDTYIHSLENDEIKVVVNSGLAANLLSTKYLDVLNMTVVEVTQTNFKLAFLQKGELEKNAKLIYVFKN